MFDLPTCYLSPTLEGKLCPDGSHGVFARQPLLAGERLAVWGGEVMPYNVLQQLSARTHAYSLQIEEDLYLVTSHVGPADWVNHSCDPNAGLEGQVVLVALRNIASGEQVCYDYAMSDGSAYDEFDCNCGSAICRGRITGSDWQLPELQQKYAGYFSPYLQRRIDALQPAVVRRQRVSSTNGFAATNT